MSEQFCDSTLRWSGHPQGWVPCELDAPHPGELHTFTWHLDDGVHTMRWSDALAAFTRVTGDG